MNLKALKKNQIVNPLNKLFSNPFGKKSAIVQDSFVHPVPAQVVSPDSSPGDPTAFLIPVLLFPYITAIPAKLGVCHGAKWIVYEVKV